jgi:DNA-binding GntR family transcriptional regulator
LVAISQRAHSQLRCDETEGEFKIRDKSATPVAAFDLPQVEMSRDKAAPPLAAAKRVIGRVVAERHDRPSLVATIACDIGAEIIQGQVKAGDDLNSVELSRRFQTSRTPIREALILLEKEGLVEIPPRRRPRVRSLALTEIREIYEARAALFVLMARAAAQQATDEDIRRLEKLLEDLRGHQARGDIESFLWANVQFFDLVTEIANNRTIRAILDSLLLRTLPLRRLSLSLTGRLNASLDDMSRMVRAFEERDGNLAAALIHSNHINALKALSAYFETGQEPVAQAR